MNTTDHITADLSPHELAAWRGLLEVHARVTQELDSQMQAEHGLSLSAYEVLMFLDDAPEHRLRMSEIADRVLLSRDGIRRFFLDHLTATDQIVLGDVWSRVQ